MRIEIHVLQNFAPSNLNRDDTGSPKDAEFGGYRRARVSSQCIKRAVREYFKKYDLIPAANRAERTKRLAKAIADRMVANGRDAAAADRAARSAVTAFLSKSENKEEHKTPYLLFLGQSEIDRFSAEVEKHWDAFSVEAAAPAPTPDAPTSRGRRRTRASDDGPKVPEGFAKAVEKLLDGGKAADLALFGRMLADLPDNNIDAACQVAHAISTNKIHSMEMDYYTAVDDLKPDDTAGADMIGTVEFNSACFYRYANLDLGQLGINLQADAELARTAATAFLEAFIHAIPTGKQNSFAAHNPPSLVFAVVRDGPPVSLANAFVKPVAPRDGESLVEKSIKALDHHYGRLVGMYGDGGRKASAFCQMENVELKHLMDDLGSVEKLTAAVAAAAFPPGGGS